MLCTDHLFRDPDIYTAQGDVGTHCSKMADAVNVQHQVKQNNEELQDFLKDLYKWEDEVQAKDKLLVGSKTVDPVISLTCLIILYYNLTLLIL